MLFLENVQGVLKHAMSVISRDLHSRGYVVAWSVVGASDVGAPHIRKRWFCLAEPAARPRLLVGPRT